MALFLGRVRLQPHRGRWRPYVDGLFGFNYIFTASSIEGTGGCAAYQCSSDIGETNLSDFVSSVGGGAGVLVDVAKPGGTRLDLSVRYLRGGEATYLVPGAIRRAGSEAWMDVSRSRTDMVVIYFGINFGR